MAAVFVKLSKFVPLTNFCKNAVLRNSLYSSKFRNYHTTPWLNKLVSFNLSDIGEGIREVTVKEWYVKVGDTVEQFQNLCEVQSDKASVTITSRYDGKITKLHYNVDEVALVGKPLLDFEVDDEDGSESSDSDDEEPKKVQDNKSVSSTASPSAPTESKDEDFARHITLATPAVRRIAMENKVNLSKVSGTGRNGRVLKGDVMEYLGQIPPGSNVPHPSIGAKAATATATTTKAAQPAPVDRVEPLKGVRKVMLKTMTESLKIPHFAYCDEIDMTRLMEFRSQLQGAAKEKGIAKLTFMPFFVKAASIALTQFPILNSSLDLEKETIIFKGAHNICIAVDSPHGLVVPNIKNCQNKSILEIALEMDALIERGRTGSLTPSDLAEGTFSLSNIGSVGGTYTHPCILAPQVSIGAMGRTKAVPRFNEKDEIVKAHVMSVSWCADHRIIDGVTMAGFSNVWKKYLENPSLFLLH